MLRVSMGADGKANTRRGVPKVGDLRLTQDLRELGSPLRTDAVVVETAKHRRGAKGESAGV